jgi:hypothetical protein
MSRSLTAWSRRVSLAEHSRSSFAFVTFCMQVPPLIFFRWSRWWLSVESPCLYVLDFVLKPVADVELLKEVFTSRVRWMSLIVEWNASANMFYLLKNLLLLILIIFKLKCSNLIFNKIMVLNASYVCLHAFSFYRESLDPDLGRRTPHFWGGFVTWSKHALTSLAKSVAAFSTPLFLFVWDLFHL